MSRQELSIYLWIKSEKMHKFVETINKKWIKITLRLKLWNPKLKKLEKKGS
jgi:hypothetical protein